MYGATCGVMHMHGTFVPHMSMLSRAMLMNKSVGRRQLAANIAILVDHLLQSCTPHSSGTDTHKPACCCSARSRCVSSNDLLDLRYQQHIKRLNSRGCLRLLHRLTHYATYPIRHTPLLRLSLDLKTTCCCWYRLTAAS